MSQVVRSARQFGVQVRNARIDRTLSQQALADLVGTGQKTISRIENGHEGAKLETIFSLLAALELELQLAPRSRGGEAIADIF